MAFDPNDPRLYDPRQWPSFDPTPNYPYPNAPASQYPKLPVVPGSGGGQPATDVQPARAAAAREAPGGPVAPAAAPESIVGSDTYDWHAVNRALTAAGLNGWQI